MAIVSIIILAIGLSMDSLAIAATSGAIIGNHSKMNVIKVAGILGIIQALLTVAGWFAGSLFVGYVDKYDHWIAFIILMALGLKVIFESFKKDSDSKPAFNPLDTKVMFGLAVAASIDAMAVGLSLSMLGQNVILPAVIIGLVTFIMSSVGLVAGCKAGKSCGNWLNIAGGIVLIVIGCSILLNHTILAEGMEISYILN